VPSSIYATGVSERDFSLQVEGVFAVPPFTLVAVGQTVTVIPVMQTAASSVVHWGDTTYTVVRGGWRATMPMNTMSHVYTVPGTYRIEYATQLADGRWNSRLATIVVSAAPTTVSTPASLPVEA
jgi:hypothetical protein